MRERSPLPDVFLHIAGVLAGMRSPCPGGATGCVLATREGRILSVGYNGPPHGWDDDLRVCLRDQLDLHGGTGYEVCPCVHAEANALAHAARHGVATDGAIAYCTREPCSACAKSLIQAGVEEVTFMDMQNMEIAPDLQKVTMSLRDVLSKRIEQAVEAFGGNGD